MKNKIFSFVLVAMLCSSSMGVTGFAVSQPVTSQPTLALAKVIVSAKNKAKAEAVEADMERLARVQLITGTLIKTSQKSQV